MKRMCPTGYHNDYMANQTFGAWYTVATLFIMCQGHEMQRNHWCDNREVTLFSWLHIYYACLAPVRFEHCVSWITYGHCILGCYLIELGEEFTLLPSKIITLWKVYIIHNHWFSLYTTARFGGLQVPSSRIGFVRDMYVSCYMLGYS